MALTLMKSSERCWGRSLAPEVSRIGVADTERLKPMALTLMKSSEPCWGRLLGLKFPRLGNSDFASGIASFKSLFT